MSTSCPSLGKVVLKSSSANSAECLNPEVWVKRKDKTQGQVKLMEEHAKQLKEEYPNLSTKFKCFPSEFIFDQKKMKNTEGFPENFQAKSNNEKEWLEAYKSEKAEKIVFDSLVKLFSTIPGSLLLKGFDTKHLFKVAAEDLAAKHKKRMEGEDALELKLTEDELQFYAILLNLDMDDFHKEVENYADELLNGKQNMTSDNLESAFKSVRTKLFPDRLVDSQRKTIKDQLKKGFQKFEREERESKEMEREELIAYLKRYLIKLLKKNDEFDHLVLTKMFATILQLEIKSYPQTGEIEPEGLKRVVKD